MRSYLKKSLALLFRPPELIKLLFAYAVFVFISAITAFDRQNIRINVIILSGLHINFVLVPLFLFFVCSRNAAVTGLYSRIRLDSRRRAFLIRAASGVVETLLFMLPYYALLLVFVRVEGGAVVFALGFIALFLFFYAAALFCISLDVVFDKSFLGFIAILPLTADCLLAMESIPGAELSVMYYSAFGFFINDPEFNMPLSLVKLAVVAALVFAAGYAAASRRE